MMAEPHRSVALRFEGDPRHTEELVDGLSAVVQTGRHLWLVCDETLTLERLTFGADGFAEHRSFDLHDLLDLPEDRQEPDLEGVAWAPPYLWVVGSHGRKRKKPKLEEGAEAAIDALARIETEDNRYLLARIPLEEDAEGGGLVPRPRCVDPRKDGGELVAARLKGEGRDSALMDALRKDEHLQRFLKIPGKDNGFDIEGLAVRGDRVFMGLRGPVLRGWAVILEVEPADDEDGQLRLKRIGPARERYRKHFLDLDGSGIRDLATDGDDLLILAGPTMDVAAPTHVFRWRGGLRVKEQSVVPQGDGLVQLMELPFDREQRKGFDNAEGMAILDAEGIPPSILVVFDSAWHERKLGDGAVLADLFAIPDAPPR